MNYRSLTIWGIAGGILLLAMKRKDDDKPTGLAAKSYLGKNSYPRGIRNNNPGNLKISSNAWRGKLPKTENSDGVFEQFKSWVYGVRAMTVLIRNYMKRYNLNTVNGIVRRYAPPVENKTNNYVAYIAKKMGVTPHTPLYPDRNTLYKLVKWMSVMENGIDVVTAQDFDAAYKMI